MFKYKHVASKTSPVNKTRSNVSAASPTLFFRRENEISVMFSIKRICGTSKSSQEINRFYVFEITMIPRISLHTIICTDIKIYQLHNCYKYYWRSKLIASFTDCVITKQILRFLLQVILRLEGPWKMSNSFSSRSVLYFFKPFNHSMIYDRQHFFSFPYSIIHINFNYSFLCPLLICQINLFFLLLSVSKSLLPSFTLLLLPHYYLHLST